MRTTTTLLSCVALAAIPSAGCDDPDLLSGLVTEGPPTVSAVIVTGETAAEATYCNPAMGDHTPALCTPGRTVEPVGDVRPIGWTARVVFKELLDPSLEDIDALGTGSIQRADPFVVRCGDAPLAYDGFYDPSGNHETLPPGPALVIHGVAQPSVATGTACRIAIRPGGVRDKDGEPAPSDVSFELAIAPLRVADSSPGAGAIDVDPGRVIELDLNSSVDPATLAGNVTLTDDGGLAVAAAITAVQETPRRIAIVPDAELAPATGYRVAVTTGVRDILGGALARPFTLSFTTAP